MRKTCLAAFLCGVAFPALADPGTPEIDEAGGVPQGYDLVWSDEFDAGTLPDPAKWAYDTYRNKDGWWNDEKQYYASERPENARIEGGNLIITARKEDAKGLPENGGQEYTSARLMTQGKAAWTYGFFEIRAKIPCGLGTWPAIWMLNDKGTWPDDGEIDIMEHVGFDPGVVHGTVHTKAYYHIKKNQRSATRSVPDACTEFHRYQMTWTADRITVGIDDKNYFSYKNDGSGRDSWPFDVPEYLILNIAVGGAWGGLKGIDPAVFPVTMEVDYVRVYQAPK